MLTLFKLNQLVAGCMLALLASQASAAVVTFKAEGTILMGYDGASLFGGMDDLTGLAYRQWITIDTAAMPLMFNTDAVQLISMDNADFRMTGRTTVNGMTHEWKVDHGNINISLWRYFDFGVPLDQAFLSVSGRDAATGEYLGANNDSVNRTTPFLDNVEIDREHALPILPGAQAGSGFMTGGAQQTSFYGIADRMSWEVSTAVPEPGSVPAVLVGLVLVGLARRKRAARNDNT